MKNQSIKQLVKQARERMMNNAYKETSLQKRNTSGRVFKIKESNHEELLYEKIKELLQGDFVPHPFSKFIDFEKTFESEIERQRYLMNFSFKYSSLVDRYHREINPIEQSYAQILK